MYQTKSLKNYVQPISLAILIALLLCNCRSAYQHSSARVSEQTDSVSVRLSSKAHGSITSQAQTQTDINGNKWKITWHFDTSKPADPVTGLPPTSKLEVEGSEIRKQVEQQENVSSQTSDSVSYQKTDTGSSNEYTQQESQKQTESGTGIERSIAIGIILLSIIIGIILYVRSHTSK
ncbi:hypothetical protein [Bacteroides cellulosilyticus]|jgi:cobalamin biosynthesis Mg chelatase CobN|uniref:hypothetical protein n=1 Tax=Bacteroides cellulosilyticus TaxID=246787 RepID=UPI0035647C57